MRINLFRLWRDVNRHILECHAADVDIAYISTGSKAAALLPRVAQLIAGEVVHGDR